MSEQQAGYDGKAKTIFRTIKNQDHPYVMIDRRPIENPDLSWGAKGVLSYLLSRPDNWTVRLRDLVKRSTDGTNKIRGYIRELVKAGHVHRVPQKDPQTHRITAWVLEVYELPFTSKATPPISIGVAFHEVENRTLNNNDSINDTDLYNGANAPALSDNLENMPIEWQIAGNSRDLKQHDQTQARRKDFANLVAMGTSNRLEAYQIALTFQDERNITLLEGKVKSQRKAIREMLEMGVRAVHVREATRSLIAREMTVTDLFSVVKTSIDLANKPEPAEETRPEYLPFPFLDEPK